MARLNDNQITKVTIKNYRSLKDVTVNLSRLNVLVGKNGSGKSNFLDAVQFVGDALRLGLWSAVIWHGNFINIQRWMKNQREDNLSIELIFDVDNVERSYAFALSDNKQGGYSVKYEKYTSNLTTIVERHDNQLIAVPGGVLPHVQENALILPLLAGLDEINPAYSFLTNMSVYEISPNILRSAEQRSPGATYPLDSHGGNFVSAFREFLKSNKEASNSIINLLKLMVPSVEGIGYTTDTNTGKSDIWLANIDGNTLQYTQESDGTLRIIAILLAIYQEPPRTLVGIEEPEVMVHPGVLDILSDVIKEASERSQIIISTHSPDLIAHFDVNNLRVVTRTEEGTQISLIDDVQREILDAELFKASDLLRIHGELRGAHTEVER